MRRKYVLHIGTNKTGTSTVQSFLFRNRKKLRDRGVLYPELGCDGEAHHEIARAIKRGTTRGLSISDQWYSELRAEARNVETVILSSEDFHTIRDPRDVARYFPPSETLVVVYVREHVRYLISWYQQAVQRRNTSVSVTEFVEIFRVQLAKLLERWCKVFGRNRVRVGLYERASLVERDIIADFLDKCDLDSIRCGCESVPEGNASVSGNLLFAKLLLNSWIDKQESIAVTGELESLANLDSRYSGRISVDRSQCEWIAWQQRDDRKSLAMKHGILMEPPDGGLTGNEFPDWTALHADLDRLFREADERDYLLAALVRRAASHVPNMNIDAERSRARWR